AGRFRPITVAFFPTSTASVPRSSPRNAKRWPKPTETDSLHQPICWRWPRERSVSMSFDGNGISLGATQLASILKDVFAPWVQDLNLAVEGVAEDMVPTRM